HFFFSSRRRHTRSTRDWSSDVCSSDLFVKIKENITTLKTNLKTETEAHQKFEKDYTNTKRDLEKTNAVLRTTQETLKASEDAKRSEERRVGKERRRGRAEREEKKRIES